MASNKLLMVVLMLAMAGFLLCAAMCTEKLPNAENIPPGTYKTSCWGCEVCTDDDDELLTCQCETDELKLNQTWYYLDGSCMAFKNVNGELICDEELQSDKSAPKGPYQDSCGGCSFNSETRVLTCLRCRDIEGSTSESTLVIPEEGCKIRNVGGNLQCGGEEPKPEEPPKTEGEEEGKFEL